jgi:FkbM family methyltransferase
MVERFDARRHTRNLDIDGVNEWIWIATDTGAWHCKDQWPKNKECILRHCKKFDVAIQAGGNQGMYARLMSNMFKYVYTFEPHWDNFCSLVLNCNSPNIVKINGALGDVHCMVNLNTPNEMDTGLWSTQRNDEGHIPQFKIDDLNLSTLDLIYLDIENGESKAIDGAIESINKFKPLIVCENGYNVKEKLYNLNYIDVDQSHADTFFISK